MPSVVRIETALKAVSRKPTPRSRRCRAPASGCPNPRSLGRAGWGGSGPTGDCGNTRAAASAGARAGSLRFGAFDLAKVLLILRGIERHVTYLRHQRRRILVVILEKGLNLRTRQGLLVHVDQERPGQRLVGAIFDRFGRRNDATGATVHTQHLESLLILDVVCETEVAQLALVTGHALHQHVVVFAGRVVGAARVFLTHDFSCEIIERA